MNVHVLKIGALELDVPFVQAALAGYSDLPMRRLARRYGAPYAHSAAILDKLILHCNKRQKVLLHLAEDDHPIGGQLIGASPDDMVPAAVALAQAGYDVIDINFACPVKKVLGRCRGGFLLSRPDIALDIVRRVHYAVGSIRPITVKLRTGMDDDPASERNFLTILDGAFDVGVAAVTVHGRTVAQRYGGASRWSFIEKAKRHVGDRVILGSGDLFIAADCLHMLQETGVDGVSIARGCIGNPWIFQECRALWRGEELPPPPSIMQQREAITGHWQDMLAEYGEVTAAKFMRKFGIKYSEHHPLTRQVRDAFIPVRTAADILRVLDTWYDPNADFPPVKRRTGPGHLVAAGAK